MKNINQNKKILPNNNNKNAPRLQQAPPTCSWCAARGWLTTHHHQNHQSRHRPKSMITQCQRLTVPTARRAARQTWAERGERENRRPPSLMICPLAMGMVITRAMPLEEHRQSGFFDTIHSCCNCYYYDDNWMKK